MDYVACVERIRGVNVEGEVWTSPGGVEKMFHMKRPCGFKQILTFKWPFLSYLNVYFAFLMHTENCIQKLHSR